MNNRDRTQARNRDLLLEAAVRRFAEGGYHGTSLADVAAEAGLTKGAVYSNFPSKRSLLLQAMAHHNEHWRGFPSMPVSEPTVVGVLRAMGEAYAARIQAAPENSRALGLTYDLLSLMSRDVDGLAGYSQVRHLVTFLTARALERVAVAEGTDRGRTMHGVAVAAIALMSAAAQARAFAPSDFHVELAGDAAAALAHLPDPAPTELPEPTTTNGAGGGLLPTGLEDVVRDRWIRPIPDAQLLVLLPLVATRDIDPLIRGIRAEDPAIDVVVVVTVPESDEDLAAMCRWNLPDLCGLLAATVPDPLLPDLALAIDEHGQVCDAMDVDRDNVQPTAFRLDHGRAVARASGPGGARALAAIGDRHVIELT